MEFLQEKNVWTRTCPQCHKIVEHKSKAKCRDAENHNRVCTKCNSSNIGRKNSTTDTCPVCNDIIKIPVAVYSNVTCQLEEHALMHGLKSVELWHKKHNTGAQLCRCQCGQTTEWTGWWTGYNDFIIGHNANIYSSYEPEIATQISKKRSAALMGKKPWCTGLTKDIDERVKKRGEATSKTLLELFKSGQLVRTTRFTNEEVIDLLSANKTLILKEIVDYKNCLSESLRVECNTCHASFLTNLAVARTDRCRLCRPVGSHIQHAVADWVESNLGTAVGRNVSGLISRRELDIYVPQYKLALEINGIYWHSERRGKTESYHQDKTEACRALGVTLLHIFEDEWENKQDIIKSMILSRANITQTRLMARKCELRELTHDEKSNFFDDNHIDGDTACTASWGLIDNASNQIVAAMSARTPFHKKYKSSIEIARFCTRLNTSVAGGFSKLLEKVIEHSIQAGKTSIISYVDERLGGTGVAYEVAGFKRIKKSPPRFWWTNGQKRFNRFSVRADKKRNMSEAQVALEKGVYKIWGCGNLVYELML